MSAATEARPAIIFGTRGMSWVLLALTGTFLVSNYLTFWQGWPGASAALGALGLFGLSAPKAGAGGLAVADDICEQYSRWIGRRCRDLEKL